jgi:electron transfer flavoprotein alpha subunit
MSVLIIAEHNNTNLSSSIFNVVTAAKQIDDDVHVFVAGYDCQAVAKSIASITGINKVLVSDAGLYQYQLAENIAPLVHQISGDYSHILAAATTTGKNLLPRIAAMLDVAQISDIIAVESPDIFVRPMYAGNIIATVQSHDAIKILTVRTTAFDPVDGDDGHAEVVSIDPTTDAGLSSFVREELTQSERPELTEAEIIVSGGRGVGSAENFKLIEELADKLGAAIGASRAAVDAGFVPNDYQVGQTGKVVAPKLYIAVGISGAIQHLAGMQDSKVIVAINKDEEAPIFQVADYGLVADLFKALPEFTNALV